MAYVLIKKIKKIKTINKIITDNPVGFVHSNFTPKKLILIFSFLFIKSFLQN